MTDVVGDVQPSSTARVVVSLDVGPGVAPGQAATSWLHDAYGSLAPFVTELESDTAELSGALARTGDASLAGGMWRSPATPDGWDTLFDSLARSTRGDASWWVGWLSDMEAGGAEARADAFFEDSHEGVALVAELLLPGAVVTGASAESAMVELLARHGGGAASFGCVGSAVEGGRTPLDRALRRPRAASLTESRQWLRGYDWATLLAPELAPRIDRRRAEVDLARVIELADGGLVLVATDRLAGFDDPALERLFGVVEPVLPRGEPQRPRLYGDEQPPRLVWRAPGADDPA